MSIAVEDALAGKRIVWGAPTFDQVRIGWDETKRAAGGIFNFTQQRMTAESPTGGSIIYRSLDDPDNARGHTADEVLIDEIGDVKPEAWFEVLRPMLIDSGGGFWGIGTPRGHNWFWREHRAALDRDDSICWQIPTVGCEIVDGKLVKASHPLENPDIDFSEIENIYSTMPVDMFRQEIMAEFIEREGSVFRNLDACLTGRVGDPSLHEGHRIVAGVDWGKQADYTSISIICADCMQELYLDRFNQIDYHFQRGRLAAACERWRITAILVESNSIGTPNLEELQRSGLPAIGFETTAVSKPPLIEGLALALEKAEYQLLDDQIGRAELEAYERKVTATGRSQYSAPQGMHDDTVIARALAVKQAGTPIRQVKIARSWRG